MMETRSEMTEELYAIESELNEIVDDMIAKYGKFLTAADKDLKDERKTSLIDSYAALMNRKDRIVESLNNQAK